MYKRILENPLNANERYLHAIATRLDVLIDQLSAISEHMAKESGTTIENVAVEEKIVEDVKKEVEKPTPAKRKRTPKKG